MTVEPTTKDKQITIDIPEDRVAEFYAFYGRFLAGGHRRRGHRHGRGHRCCGHGAGGHQRPADESAAPPDAGTQTA